MVDYLEGNYNRPNLYTSALSNNDTKVDKAVQQKESAISPSDMAIPQDRFIYIQAPPQNEKRGLFGGFLNGAFTTMLMFSITVAFIFSLRGAKELIHDWGWFKPKFKEDNPVILQAKKFFQKFDRQKFDLSEGIYNYKWQKLNCIPDDGNYIHITNSFNTEITKKTKTYPKYELLKDPKDGIAYTTSVTEETKEVVTGRKDDVYKTIMLYENGKSKLSVDRVIKNDTVAYYMV